MKSPWLGDVTFDPLSAQAVEGEVVVLAGDAALHVSLTPAAARLTAERLLAAAREAEAD
jgi:hypothetical protein